VTWLVTGGAGYVGAHIVRALLDAGHDVTVIDDLSSGHAHFVPAGVPFVRGSILDRAALDEALAGDVDGVVHAAAFKYAGVSAARPLHAYRQNVSGTVELLQAMAVHGVRRIVYSSSAAVYGTPQADLVTEDSPTAPESPYGETKLISEWLLRDLAAATGLQHTSLRYFNVTGSAAPGVRDTSPHNLIPLLLTALASGSRPRIFGDDYPTPDGTCIRDYVHVADVARAHVAAAWRLTADLPTERAYNLGSGSGTSVAEIMTVAAQVTGTAAEPEICPRRAGDPARIVASGDLAARDLDWKNRHTIRDMIAAAWAAQQSAAVAGLLG
jgi:UDP-glucose 4-epimerase